MIRLLPGRVLREASLASYRCPRGLRLFSQVSFALNAAESGISTHKRPFSQVIDCQSYLDYCLENNVALDTTHFKGTFYEYTTKDFLERHLQCHQLNRVGGAFDNGIDLYGKWSLDHFVNWTMETTSCHKSIMRNSLVKNSKQFGATSSICLVHDINVLVQCKNFRKRITAATIRELAGIYHFHVKSRDEMKRTFFFLVSPFPLTKQGQAQMDLTNVPIIHFKLSPLALQKDGDVYDLASWSDGGALEATSMNNKATSMLKGIDLHIQWKMLSGSRVFQG